MFEAIKKLFAGEPARRLEAKPDPRGLPGTRVYHEYFVGDTPEIDGSWPWLCRVYAANGATTEASGSTRSRVESCQQAITWAESTKAGLRGEA